MFEVEQYLAEILIKLLFTKYGEGSFRQFITGSHEIQSMLATSKRGEERE